MSKLRNMWIVVLIAAVVSFSLTGCSSKEEPAPTDDSAAGVQAQQTSDQNEPTDEQPMAEHPGGEHPTGEHPQ